LKYFPPGYSAIGYGVASVMSFHPATRPGAGCWEIRVFGGVCHTYAYAPV
jgi:hypothetical protein